MTLNSRRILILTDWYLPGYKAGGPITSVFNMLKCIASQADFFVLTRNTDWHDDVPYDLEPDVWLENEDGYRVKYMSKPGITHVMAEIRSQTFDVVYFNGIYSPLFNSIPLLRFLSARRRPELIVAPRGMLNANAIALKSIRKIILLSIMQSCGIARKVRFHSTGPLETEAIRNVFPNAVVHEIANIPAVSDILVGSKKSIGFLSVARISPVKNTLLLLRTFHSAGSLDLTLVGTTDDAAYLQDCLETIDANPEFHCLGGKDHAAIIEYYRKSRFFVSMTTGENFGHAIIEALAHGCPAIISDRTPWNDLEAFGAGFVVPLSDGERWEEVLRRAAEMDNQEYHRMSTRAIEYVKRKFDVDQLKAAYIQLFSA